jgi:alpha-D-ribose 1-methylphosphonate 5-triphosphate synthase subunit PhnH
MLAPAFSEPALASQAAFRAVMDAFARPGEIRPLSRAAAAPAPLSTTAAALALALLDYECPLWLDAALARAPDVVAWIRFHIGARVTSDSQGAAFAILAEPAQAPPFDQFSLGTAEYPDRSTTLLLQVERFGQGPCLSLTGPGIATRARLCAEPLPPDLADRLGTNRALFPRGVDMILVGPDAVAALPRSVIAVGG